MLNVLKVLSGAIDKSNEAVGRMVSWVTLLLRRRKLDEIPPGYDAGHFTDGQVCIALVVKKDFKR